MPSCVYIADIFTYICHIKISNLVAFRENLYKCEPVAEL